MKINKQETNGAEGNKDGSWNKGEPDQLIIFMKIFLPENWMTGKTNNQHIKLKKPKNLWT